jgi:hypothetical protein
MTWTIDGVGAVGKATMESLGARAGGPEKPPSQLCDTVIPLVFSILQDGLASIPGVSIYGTMSLENRVPTMSVNLANYDAADVGAFLDVDHDILTRTGLHCAPLLHAHYGTSPRGTVRFSIGPFNTEEQILRTVQAVEKVQAQRPTAEGEPVSVALEESKAKRPWDWDMRDGC